MVMSGDMDNLHWGRANILAGRIEKYWQNRGYDKIEVSLVQIDKKECAALADKKPLYAVRSNMVRGFPPQHRMPAPNR